MAGFLGNPEASRFLVEQTQSFSDAVDNLIFKAAGNEILSEMDKMEPGKPMGADSIRRVALKYKLTPDKMNKLGMMMYESGAIQQKNMELKAKWEEDQRDQALIDKSKTEANPQGDPLWLIKEREKKKIETEGDIQKLQAKPETPIKFQESGVTERGSLPVGYNQQTNELVVADNGQQRLYDPRRDGRIMSKNLSQGVVIKLEQDKKMATEVSDDALALAANQYLMTGNMPALGMGNANLRMKVLNKASEIAKGMGLDPSSIPALQAGFNAQKQALRTLTNATANFGAFESGMIKNADYALTLSDKFPRSSIPPVNAVMNAIKTKTGNPDIVKFSNALYAAALEYEKIRTAGTNVSSAELSVGAQKKAEELINTAQTHEQLKAAVEAMKVDAKNIMDSRRDEMKSLGDSMAGWGGRGNKPQQSGSINSGVEYLNGAPTRQDALKRLHALKEKGWSDEQLKEASNNSKWK